MMKTLFLAVVICFSSHAFAILNGAGTQANPYLIQSRADFDEFANPANAGIYWVSGVYTKLMCNINLSGTTYTQAVIAPDTSTNIGFQGTPFKGVFDGNGYKVSNLTINTSTNEYIGLFGYVGLGGLIQDMGIEDINITGSSYIGGLVGANDHGTLTRCYVAGSVKGTNNTFSRVGGLVGANDHGTLISCSAHGTVNGNYDVGGLVGRNDLGTLIYCHASDCSVSGTGSAVGGLVGKNSGTLISCYATTSVSGTYDVGGLVGYNTLGTLTNCYATGSVSGSGPLGGLVGFQGNLGNLTNCYATGSVTGSIPAGGLVGSNANGGTLTSCFWDIQTSGQTVGVGSGSSTGVTGKTTAQMKTLSTFTTAGWDFTNEITNGTANYWRMCVDGVDYPRLNWQSIDGDLSCPNGVTIEDLAVFVSGWLSANCAIDNNFCGGVDMDTDGKVNLFDYAVIAENWMAGI